MPRSALTIARLLPAADPAPPDVPLLRTFVASGSAAGEAAFEELVRRYGPMVLSTCRRVLGNPHDAEDAFQATFLVLARKAATIRGNLAGWLYAVAVRTARGVRVMRDRRRKHELASGGRQPVVELNGSDPDLASILDEEIAKLPALFREAVVLCELRGLSRKDAAREIGIPEGTLSSRLAGAKRRLAALLASRGLAAPVALVSLGAPTAVSAALVRSAVLATRGASTAVASAAASAVVKGMLFEQLRVVVLAAGLLMTAVCGGWAMTGSPGDGPAPAPAPRAAEDTVAKLVAKLGTPEFADREAAEKKLRAMGLKAKAAVKAGLKSDNPEVRKRAADVLAAIHKDLAAMHKEQFWPRFAKLIGDDEHARALFDAIRSVPRNIELIEAAEKKTEDVSKLYAERRAELNDRCTDRMRLEYHPARVSAAEMAGFLYLGTFPGAADGKFARGGAENHFIMFFRSMWRNTGYPFSAALTEGPLKTGCGRLLVKWTESRTHSQELERGLNGAIAFGLSDIVPFAKAYVRKTMAARPEYTPDPIPLATIAVGKLGTKDDFPFLMGYADDRAVVCRAFMPLPEDEQNPPKDFRPGTDITLELRDVAVVAALVLCGQSRQQIDEHGFFVSRYDPLTAGGQLPPINKRRWVNDPLTIGDLGFVRDADREAAHKRAKEFLDKQKAEPKKDAPDPAVAKLVQQLGAEDFAIREAAQKALRELGLEAEAALKAGLKSENPEIVKRCRELLDQVSRDGFFARHWPRFSKIVGDDKASRELFDRIRSLKRNVELLDAVVADPGSAGKLYHDRWKELNAASRTPSGPGSFTLSAAPLADVVGWIYLGTFPGAEGSHHQSSSLDFLPVSFHSTSRSPLPVALKDREASAALRVLVGKWTAARTDYVGRDFGLQLALAYDIAEVLPAARETLMAKMEKDPYPGNTARNVGFAMLMIGKLGTKDDLLLLEQYAKDETQCARFLHDPPPRPGQPAFHLIRPPIEGRDTTTQLRDIAVAMRLHRLDQKPEEFGFHWSWPYGDDAGKPNKLGTFHLHANGFLRDADREAAHKKAREWLDKQKE